MNIYQYKGEIFHDHKLLTLNDECAFACDYLFKEHPCYEQSAASIFKNPNSTKSFLELVTEYKHATFQEVS